MFGNYTRVFGFAQQVLAAARKKPVLFAPLAMNIALAVPVNLALIILSLFLSDSLAMALMPVGLSALYFIDYFAGGLNTAMVYQEQTAGNASLGSALKLTLKSTVGIVIFAVVSGLLDFAVQILSQRRLHMLRPLLLMIRSFWSTATFVIMPAMIIEGLSFGAAFKRSKDLAENDPTQIGVGYIGIGIVTSLISLAGFLLTSVVGARILMPISPLLGLTFSLVVVNATWAIAAYLKSTYYTCYYMWTRECERNRGVNPAFAPTPLRNVLADVDFRAMGVQIAPVAAAVAMGVGFAPGTAQAGYAPPPGFAGAPQGQFAQQPQGQFAPQGQFGQQPQGFAPGPQGFAQQPQGFAAPSQPQGFAAPPPSQGFGQPQPQGFAAPPQSQGFAQPHPQGFAAPQPQGFAAPPQSQGFAQPQPQGFAAPPQSFASAPQPQAFAAPAPQPQFAAPAPQAFAAPAPQPQFAAPAPQPQFAAPQPQFAAPAPQPKPFVAPAPQPQPQFAAPAPQPQFAAPAPQAFAAPAPQPQFAAPQPRPAPQPSAPPPVQAFAPTLQAFAAPQVQGGAPAPAPRPAYVAPAAPQSSPHAQTMYVSSSQPQPRPQPAPRPYAPQPQPPSSRPQLGAPAPRPQSMSPAPQPPAPQAHAQAPAPQPPGLHEPDPTDLQGEATMVGASPFDDDEATRVQ